jgi:hypothetical protein
LIGDARPKQGEGEQAEAGNDAKHAVGCSNIEFEHYWLFSLGCGSRVRPWET